MLFALAFLCLHFGLVHKEQFANVPTVQDKFLKFYLLLELGDFVAQQWLVDEGRLWSSSPVGGGW